MRHIQMKSRDLPRFPVCKNLPIAGCKIIKNASLQFVGITVINADIRQ